MLLAPLGHLLLCLQSLHFLLLLRQAVVESVQLLRVVLSLLSHFLARLVRCVFGQQPPLLGRLHVRFGRLFRCTFSFCLGIRCSQLGAERLELGVMLFGRGCLVGLKFRKLCGHLFVMLSLLLIPRPPQTLQPFVCIFFDCAFRRDIRLRLFENVVVVFDRLLSDPGDCCGRFLPNAVALSLRGHFFSHSLLCLRLGTLPTLPRLQRGLLALVDPRLHLLLLLVAPLQHARPPPIRSCLLQVCLELPLLSSISRLGILHVRLELLLRHFQDFYPAQRFILELALTRGLPFGRLFLLV